MSNAALHSARAGRVASTDRDGTTQRWTVGTLTVATALLGAHLVLLVTATGLLAALWSGFLRNPVSLDLASVAAAVAPVLLVGWCTGLAASAVLGRMETLGARTAGILAGGVGGAVGTAVLTLTGLL